MIKDMTREINVYITKVASHSLILFYLRVIRYKFQKKPSLQKCLFENKSPADGFIERIRLKKKKTTTNNSEHCFRNSKRIKQTQFDTQ